MLRFTEKNIDKIVIDVSNKPVDNIPRKIQVQSLENRKYFPDMAKTASTSSRTYRTNSFTCIRFLGKD